MNLEEQIRIHKEISQKIDELEEQKKILSMAIMQQMEGKTFQSADYLVRKITRLSIKISLDDARALDAIKMEETVDKEKIKEYHQKGIPIEGVSEYEYITVTIPKQT
jgi:hypothetical protein